MASATNESTDWQYIGEPNLYSYRGLGVGRIDFPVLMVDMSDQSPQLWDVLGVHFMGDGFKHIYACRLREDAPLVSLVDVIERVREDVGAPRVLLLAYGEAAAHALHFVEERQGYLRVQTLVGINGQYQRNALSYLEGFLLARDEMVAPMPQEANPGSADLVSRFGMLNIYGQAPTSYLNPDRVITPLPEAINLGMNLHPSAVMQSPDVYNALRTYLRGRVWQIQLQLSSLQMRLGAPGVPMGQFVFEVNGQRVPPDGVFAPPDQTMYDFEYFTPLGAVAQAAKPDVQAANITFRLREVGRAAHKRRALVTKLHIPLIDGAATDHNMQDNFGSVIKLRVHCNRAPKVIGSNKQ